jgi:hypothetical protein
MGGTRSTHGEMRNEYNISVGILKGREHGEDEEVL